MRAVIASHGHCFDGLASAALFTSLLRKVQPAPWDFSYRTLGYAPQRLKESKPLFTGEQNALLDYRFNPSPLLNWYFDHHRTAFATEQDRDCFVARQAEGKFFYDPAVSSCAKLIDRIGREQFGVAVNLLDELVAWADVIDSANFPSPQAAIDHSNPILRFANVIEHHGNDELYAQLVPQLLSQPLSEVAASPAIASLYAPLAGKREGFMDLVRQHATTMGRVVFVDLTSEPLEAVAKFATYALFPSSVYSVIVGRLDESIKISVGYNPWCGQARDVDVSAICVRYGGGGHAMVGGIAFALSQVDHALVVARDVARELDGASHVG